jgi:RIP metalloprotease RseP
MNPFQELTPEELPRTFGAKPIWQRATVILAGPVTHFVMAAFFLALFFMAIGVPTDTRPVVDAVEASLNGLTSPAAVAGLRAGDEIVALDGRPVESSSNFVAYTRAHVGQPIQITVVRDGQRVTVTATPVLSQIPGETQPRGRLGITLGEARQRYGPITAVGKGVSQTVQTAKDVVLQLGQVFGPGAFKRLGELVFGGAQRQSTDPTGIIGVTQLAGEAVRVGAWDFLFGLLVVFNVFVGILNLVPLPPLDGGHLAVLAYEKMRGRRPDPRKLIPLTTAVAGIIVLYALAVSYLDIVKPLPSPFR